MKTFETQIGGDHYQRLAIQPTEYIVKNNLSWREGNVIKYITRWPFKGKTEQDRLQDLLKCRHYLDMIIEEAEEKNKGVIR